MGWGPSGKTWPRWASHRAQSTSTRRIPAINLYLSFGFVPLVQNDEERRAWQGIRERLKYPIPPP